MLASLLLGPDEHTEPLPPAGGEGVRAALERALLAPLQQSPCVVSFSGGRDSSLILALATLVARRHGLPDPLPVTMRFPDEPLSDETHWQELVLGHLGIQAETVKVRDELDALGDVATESLRRLGVRWPANAYLHAPVLELARGGALLTGVGGDELLGTSASRHVWLLRGRSRPRRGDPRAVAGALRPRSAREAAWLRNAPGFPWLTPVGEERVQRVLARDETGWPHRWDRTIRHWHASRAFAAVAGMIGLYAQPYGVTVSSPLLASEVLAELMREAGPTGYPGRTAAMRRLVGDLLPERLVTRETKAGFNRAVFGPGVRAFAREWDGSGLDPALVDAEALRRTWLSDTPDFRSVILLHEAWLGAQASPASS
jgi:asparagine synthase (glutamine-hydrolysing)